MRSPFSFISSNVRVVMLDMFPFQLGDFSLPEIAVRELRMRNRKVLTPHRLGAEAHDVEVERPRPPAVSPLALSSPLRLDRPALREQLLGRERGLEQNHLVQIRRLRNRADRRGFLDLRRRHQPGAGKGCEPHARMGQVRVAVTEIRAEGDKDPLS